MIAIPVVALALVALIHVLPSLGVMGGKGLSRLYGQAQVTGDVALLLRHRAAIFATLTVMSAAAIFATSWQVPVLLFALGSVASFVVLWLISRNRSAAINRVAYVDLALIPVIVAGLVVAWIAPT